jgi:hypothetical protein
MAKACYRTAVGDGPGPDYSTKGGVAPPARLNLVDAARFGDWGPEWRNIPNQPRRIKREAFSQQSRRSPRRALKDVGGNIPDFPSFRRVSSCDPAGLICYASKSPAEWAGRFHLYARLFLNRNGK